MNDSTANHPAPAPDASAAGIASYLFEMGLLKHARRTGWWTAGIKDPETIAEHSFRTAILATLLATMEGADPARAAHLASSTTRKRRASATSPTSAAAT